MKEVVGAKVYSVWLDGNTNHLPEREAPAARLPSKMVTK